MDIPRLTLPLAYTGGGIPVYPIRGAAGDDEFDLDVDPDEGGGADPADPGESEGGKKGAKYEPPSHAEWVKVQASLARSNASAKEKREANQKLQRELQELRDREAAREAEEERRKLLADRQPPAPADAARGKGKRAASATPPAAPSDLPAGVLTPAQVRAELAKAKREEREAVAAEYQDRERRSAARVALSDAQVPKASLQRLVRLIDLDEIELDADGEVVGGLEEQIEVLRAELPQLFAAAEAEPTKKSRPRPPRIPQASAADRPPASDEPKSSADRIAALVLGGR